jgi:hypothetical protein
MLAHPGGHPSPRLLAEGELRGYPGAGLVLWGLKAGFSSNVGWRLTLSGDAGAMFGERPYDAGTIRVRAGTTGLSLGPRWNPEHMVTITVGARGEVGWAELSGQPSDTSLIYGASRSSLIAGVAACGTIEGPSRGVVRARLSAQGGAMLRGLVGDIGGSSTTGLSGFYWSVGFALALVPWKRAIE